MRNSVIGLIIGTVLGIVLGATVIAPRLQRSGPDAVATAPAPPPADLAKQLPRALVPRPDVSMKMANAYPPDTPIVGGLARRIDARIWDVSRGQFEIRSYPPGALAPVSDLFEAVGAGSIDAALAPPPPGGEKYPALALFSGVPFGPESEEFLGWMAFGGGQLLLDEINQQNGVHGIICGLLPASAFGWFRHEVQSPQELRGVRIRASGLGGKVLARLGADVADLPLGELVVAIEQGAIDAVSWASPMLDRQMGFGTWLKNYYPQGGTQSLTLLQLMINQRKWQSLNATQRAQIESVCGDNVQHSLAEGEAGQFHALQEIYTAGVHLHRLPPSVRDAMERAWQQVIQQEANANAEVRRVWQSLVAFRTNFAAGREVSSR